MGGGTNKQFLLYVPYKCYSSLQSKHIEYLFENLTQYSSWCFCFIHKMKINLIHQGKSYCMSNIALFPQYPCLIKVCKYLRHTGVSTSADLPCPIREHIVCYSAVLVDVWTKWPRAFLRNTIAQHTTRELRAVCFKYIQFQILQNRHPASHLSYNDLYNTYEADVSFQVQLLYLFSHNLVKHKHTFPCIYIY